MSVINAGRVLLHISGASY